MSPLQGLDKEFIDNLLVSQAVKESVRKQTYLCEKHNITETFELKVADNTYKNLLLTKTCWSR